MYICVCIYITTTKKPHHVSDLSKLDALLHLQRYQGSTCVDPKNNTSNLAYQPFSKTNKPIKTAVWVGRLEVKLGLDKVKHHREVRKPLLPMKRL